MAVCVISGCEAAMAAVMSANCCGETWRRMASYSLRELGGRVGWVFLGGYLTRRSLPLLSGDVFDGGVKGIGLLCRCILHGMLGVCGLRQSRLGRLL